jgi:hypothetical protein
VEVEILKFLSLLAVVVVLVNSLVEVVLEDLLTIHQLL